MLSAAGHDQLHILYRDLAAGVRAAAEEVDHRLGQARCDAGYVREVRVQGKAALGRLRAAKCQRHRQ